MGGTVSVKVMLLAPAFRNLDAVLEEASKISGASGVRTFFRIIIPVMMPAILVTTILGLIRSLEAFEIELLLGTPIGLQVYSTKIHELVTWEPPQFAPAMALSTVFLGALLLMVALQRKYIGKRSYETITGRGFSIRPTPLGRWRWPAFAMVLFFAVFITLVPTTLLLLGTFMKLFGFFNIADPWTLENWRATLSDPVLSRSLWNTLAIGFGSGLVGVFFYSLIAYVVVKTRHTGRGLLDFLSWLPWSVPGILLGIALLWTFLQTRIFLPIYGTIYILMIAMVIKSMPFGAQMIKSVLIQLGSDLEEASKVCGATWFDTFRRVILPLIMPAMITVALVGFISAARDISTVVLARFRQVAHAVVADARFRRRRRVRKSHGGRGDHRRSSRGRGTLRPRARRSGRGAGIGESQLSPISELAIDGAYHLGAPSARIDDHVEDGHNPVPNNAANRHRCGIIAGLALHSFANPLRYHAA